MARLSRQVSGIFLYSIINIYFILQYGRHTDRVLRIPQREQHIVGIISGVKLT